ETTGLADYLTIHGVMLFAIGGFLAVELLTLAKSLRRYGTAGWLTIGLMVVFGIGGTIAAVTTDMAAFAIVLLIAAIGLCTLNRHLSPLHLFTFAIIALAL